MALSKCVTARISYLFYLGFGMMCGNESPPDIYFWEPNLSPHKLPLFRAVEKSILFGSAYYIAEEELATSRVAQGWRVDGLTGNILVAPSAEQVERIVQNSAPNSIHIFAGLRRISCVVAGMRVAIQTGRKFGVFSEPRVFEGIAGYARLVQSWLTESHIRENASFILAVGRHGPSWFKMTGYDPRITHPFAYFIDVPESAHRALNSRPRLGFVGRLEPVKGADLFMRAIEHISADVEVHIAGTGSLEAMARQICSKKPGARTYHGVVSMENVPALLRSIDILVLPSISKDDGWGVVVSEALMAGAAVIASDRVGASRCLDGERGMAIADLTPESIAGAIDTFLSGAMDLGENAKLARSTWARAHLSADAGARHLHNILRNATNSSIDFI